MKYILSFFTFFQMIFFACGQQIPAKLPHLQNEEFDKKVESLLLFSVPVIGVEELNNIQSEVHIFDAREKEEFEVSHIPGAVFLGYQDFDPSVLQSVPKNDKIVLYCSVGYRSEKIGEKLKQLGYTQVYNLYGSLFEWANRDYPLVDKKGKPTKKIHTYNRNWSKWVEEGKAEKVW
ncbi:MAG: rhodanese-like domain-containing protein [Saprospiraceae bacterium]|nr:rhodanese-like domain-containing protein [Lewinella sp.]